MASRRKGRGNLVSKPIAEMDEMELMLAELNESVRHKEAFALFFERKIELQKAWLARREEIVREEVRRVAATQG